MELVVPGDRLPALTHILSCLYRWHDHCWMSVYRDEPQPMDGGERSPGATEAPQVHFSAVNASGSAYALFVLPSTFFDHLVLHDASLFECLLHVKTLLNILRTKGPILRCTFATSSDNASNRLVLTLDCEHGVRKRHKLTYEDRACLFPAVEADAPYVLAVQPSRAREWTEHFMQAGKSGECSLHATPNACAIRSKMDGPLDGQVRQSIQSEIRIPMEELDRYAVTDDTQVYFSLWEFRAAVAAAEMLDSQLTLEFFQGGDPLFLRLETMEGLRGDFILATTGEPQATPAPRKRTAPRQETRHTRPATIAMPAAQDVPPPPSAHPRSTRVKDDSDDDDDDLLPVRAVRPKTEPLSPGRLSASPPIRSTPPQPSASATPSPTQRIAPTPAEVSGSHDEHPSTLFDAAPLSPPWPLQDRTSPTPEEWPPTQASSSSHSARPRKPFQPLFL